MREKGNPAASSFIQPGERLPELQLSGAQREDLRLPAPELGSPALLFVRDAVLDRDADCIRSWEEQLPELTVWYGRPIVITETRQLAAALPVARAAPDAWNALGIEPGACALIIADRWGMIYLARQARRLADLPDVRATLEWLRFLATQCPECGVIDEPGYGEWAP